MAGEIVNTNGKWTMYLTSVLISLLIIVVTTTATNVIANDKDSRARDTSLGDLNEAYEKESRLRDQILAERIHAAQIETNKILSSLQISIGVMQTDIKYLKEQR